MCPACSQTMNDEITVETKKSSLIKDVAPIAVGATCGIITYKFMPKKFGVGVRVGATIGASVGGYFAANSFIN